MTTCLGARGFGDTTSCLEINSRQENIRGVAQSGLARLHGVQEVGGSNPLAPTNKEPPFTYLEFPRDK